MKKKTNNLIKTLTCLAVCAVMVLAFAGCTVTVRPAGSTNETVFGIGLSLADPESAYAAGLTEAFQAAADELSLPLYVAEPPSDAADQAAGLDILIARGARVLVVDAMDPEILAEARGRAASSNIPLISLESPIEGSICHIVSDNVQGADLAARYLADALGESAKVVELAGTSGSAGDRSAGFHTIADVRLAVSAHQEQLSDRDGAKAAMASMLRADATIQGVYATDTELALGALDAITEKGEDVVVAGFDVSYETLKAVQAGTMDALVAPQPEHIAEAAVKTAADLLQDLMIPSLIPVEMALVTGRNADAYLKLVEIPEYARPCDVGLSVPDASDPFFAALIQGAEAAAAELGISLTVRDAQQDAALQAEGIEAMLAKQIKVLLISPVAGDNLDGILAAARESGIRIIALDTPMEGSDCHIAADNLLGGQLAARFLLDSQEEGTRVALLEGSNADRIEGFRTAAGEALNIVVSGNAGGDREQAKARMREMIDDTDKIQAVFAADDAMALGALDTLEEDGRAIPVIGFGGSGEALAAIEEGRLAATVSCPPEGIGRAAMETAQKFLAGEAVESTVAVEVTLVTKPAAEAAEEPAGEAVAETTEETVAETAGTEK